MNEAAAELRFEQAARYKARLDALAKFEAKSVIVNPSLGNLDVFYIITDDTEAYCNFVRVAMGTMVAGRTMQLSVGAESDPATILGSAIRQMLPIVAGGKLNDQVIVPFVLPT